MDEERRRYPRFQVPVKVHVRGGGIQETCLCSEIGIGGCRITLSRKIPEGAFLHIELSSTRLPDPVAGGAQVAWISQAAPWHTGLSFAPSLVEAMGGFLRSLVGTTRLVAGDE